MKVVTAEQMREMDRRVMEEFDLPGVVLMENAGRAVVEVMAARYGPLRGKRVAVFCGSGNNGGDGFVVARLLQCAGVIPSLYMIGNPAALKGDARIHFDVACALGINLVVAEKTPPEAFSLARTDLIVDALLGTGIKDAPRAPYAEAIAAINRANCPVIAVDIPSGVNADTGAIPGEAVRATHTVTFGYPKLGLLNFPGAGCVGQRTVADIGFDWERLQVETTIRLLTQEELRPCLQKRQAESNKGDYGHVAIVAGSRSMAGAPALAAKAAQRAGAGLVTVLTPACVQPILAGKLDEQMTLALPEADGAVSEAAFEVIARFAEKATALCIGPGLTTAPGTVSLVHRLLAEIEKPIVLDADGLNALAQRPEVVLARPENPRAPLILTPHPGEAARLLGISIAEVQADRLSSARALAHRYRAVIVLKGRYTLIAEPNGSVAINTTGNPGMATGGAGDVLTGVIGGLLAQGIAPARDREDLEDYCAFTLSPGRAAALGVYVHGKAGDLAAAQQGEVGLIAGDIIEHLPAAIRLLEEEE